MLTGECDNFMGGAFIEHRHAVFVARQNAVIAERPENVAGGVANIVILIVILLDAAGEVAVLDQAEMTRADQRLISVSRADGDADQVHRAHDDVKVCLTDRRRFGHLPRLYG